MKTNPDLKGKRSLITGAAKRLGREISLALARSGVHVVLHHHSSDTEARELRAQCLEYGVKAEILRADLSVSGEAAGLVDQACACIGPLDILINNASIFPSGTPVDLTEDELFSNIRVNALAPFLIGREFAAQATDGVIINLLDARVVEYDRAHAAYHLSKRMLASLTRMMALEFAPKVRVNGIAPGLILPPEGRDEKYFHSRIKEVPLGRHGEAADVTRTVCFLLESPFITGQIIFVDGGQRMKGDTYGF